MYWISAEVSNTDQVEALRNSVLSELPNEQYDPETYPHITIVPAFTLPDTADVGTIETAIENDSFSITFSAYHIWPSEETPMVIALEPDAKESLETIQSRVLSAIEHEGGTIEIEPTDFHLTVCKGGDGAEHTDFDVTTETVESVNEIVSSSQKLPLTITFEDIQLKEWDA